MTIGPNKERGFERAQALLNREGPFTFEECQELQEIFDRINTVELAHLIDDERCSEQLARYDSWMRRHSSPFDALFLFLFLASIVIGLAWIARP